MIPAKHPYAVSATIAGLMLIHISGLLFLEREWTGGCVGFWQASPSPACNSMHLTDPYTFMHIAFGLALGTSLAALRPAWSKREILQVVVFSSTVWELVENLPPIISAFTYDDRFELAYDGDSIVNSVSDTVATALGGVVSLMLTRNMVVFSIVLVEVVISATMQDGFIFGVMRLIVG